jgi:predicted nucleic-acid-binding Zn-ribbon protein
MKAMWMCPKCGNFNSKVGPCEKEGCQMKIKEVDLEKVYQLENILSNCQLGEAIRLLNLLGSSDALHYYGKNGVPLINSLNVLKSTLKKIDDFYFYF